MWLVHQSIWCPGAWATLGILRKDISTPSGFQQSYWVKLTLGNSDIEFCNKSRWEPWGTQEDSDIHLWPMGILLPWWGFWHNLFLSQNPHGLSILLSWGVTLISALLYVKYILSQTSTHNYKTMELSFRPCNENLCFTLSNWVYFIYAINLLSLP